MPLDRALPVPRLRGNGQVAHIIAREFARRIWARSRRPESAALVEVARDALATSGDSVAAGAAEA